jgi:LPS export ABC transporter protein LptC
MPWGKTIFFLHKAALLLGCFFVMVACENDEAIVNNLYDKKIAVEEAFKIESFMSEGGKVKAKLTAPYMLRYQADSPYIEFTRSLHVDFYDDSARVESILDARYAKYMEYARKVLLRDSVRVINLRDGDTLRTQELWWDQNTQEFYTTDTAYIHQPDKVMMASKGLKSRQNLSSYNFFGASGGVLVPPSGVPQ